MCRVRQRAQDWLACLAYDADVLRVARSLARVLHVDIVIRTGGGPIVILHVRAAVDDRRG